MSAFLIATLIGLCLLIAYAVIGLMLAPKQHDHYAKPFGDYPKVPHG